jgi:hypothetical protein
VIEMIIPVTPWSRRAVRPRQAIVGRDGGAVGTEHDHGHEQAGGNGGDA